MCSEQFRRGLDLKQPCFKYRQGLYCILKCVRFFFFLLSILLSAQYLELYTHVL